ncbi:MAG: hypothetical protein JJT78_00320 [Leptospira sp.]|nr:hypothetical protein [Leptospira sp.]
MYKKTHLIQYLQLSLTLLFSLTCTLVSEKYPTQIPIFPNEIEYKFKNGQVFIKIALASSRPHEKLIHQWALLDSSATENLMVDIDSEKTSFVFWQNGRHSLKQIFQPLGNSTPSDYKIILGQPFFRANCIILNRGVPEFIEPNNKKRCSAPAESDYIWIPLQPKKGQMVLNATINGIKLEFALDTGSGMTAVPGSKLTKSIYATSKRVNVLYTFGQQKKQVVYILDQPIGLNEKLKFQPYEVLDSEQVWVDNFDYFPTLGMDFFRTFRVYIDFGSKSIGIEDHEKQR